MDEIKFGLDEILELQNEKSNDHEKNERRGHSAEELDIIQEGSLLKITKTKAKPSHLIFLDAKHLYRLVCPYEVSSKIF